MTSVMMMELLDFEEQRPHWSGLKDEAIRARFGMPPARYFQLLHRTIDTTAALEARPTPPPCELTRSRTTLGQHVGTRWSVTVSSSVAPMRLIMPGQTGKLRAYARPCR